MLRTTARVSLVLLAISAVTACDGGGLEGGDPLLPSLDVFVIPSPSETSSSQASSAACASGTTSIDRIDALIDEENALSAADRALIEAALSSTPEGDLVLARYEAEVDGRTLKIEVVSEEDTGSVFTGTLVVGEEETEVLSGTVTADAKSGSLVLEWPDAEEISVAYDEDEDGVRRVARTRGSHEAVFELSDDDARLVVDDVVAWWNIDASSGVIIDGEDILCFEGGESEGDLCDLTCTPALIEKVTEQ